MAEPWGRRIARGVLEHAGVFRLSFTRDAAETAFNEGGRNGGLRLLALIQTHAPDQYIPMMGRRTLTEQAAPAAECRARRRRR